MPVSLSVYGLDEEMLKREFLSHSDEYPHYGRVYLGPLSGLPDVSELVQKLPGKIVRSSILGNQQHYFLLSKPSAMFFLYIRKPPTNRGCEVSLNIIAKTTKEVLKHTKHFKEFYSQFEEQPSDETAKFIISHCDPHGSANFYGRHLTCPIWQDMRDNYLNQDKIEELINLDNPCKGGRLIFWHGKPGTGKTYAIRALAQEWKRKAHILYVVDPESFFNRPSYMFQCLLKEFGGDNPNEPTSPKDEGTEKGEKTSSKSKFKLFIIEDALDFLLAKNRQRMSPSMSRLLNLTEGIIGQGFELLILITSNEDIGRIDSAFMRPGRCLQSLEFTSFDLNQACEWLQNHGISGMPSEYSNRRSWTLADLYAIMFGKKLGVDKGAKPFAGFHK